MNVVEDTKVTYKGRKVRIAVTNNTNRQVVGHLFRIPVYEYRFSVHAMVDEGGVEVFTKGTDTVDELAKLKRQAFRAAKKYIRSVGKS